MGTHHAVILEAFRANTSLHSAFRFALSAHKLPLCGIFFALANTRDIRFPKAPQGAHQ